MSEGLTGRCDGIERHPNPCTCDCEGCKHHCSAHVESGQVPSQADVLAWVTEHWPEHVTPVWRAVKVGEEAGEVLGAVFKADLGIKPRSAIRIETAQLMVCAMALAEAEGFDWREAVADEWQDMASRVWTKVAGCCDYCGCEFTDSKAWCPMCDPDDTWSPDA